jgi:hypothetical protein
VTSSPPSSRRTALTSARSMTTCGCTATGNRSLSPAASGGTATTALSCRGRRARTSAFPTPKRCLPRRLRWRRLLNRRGPCAVRPGAAEPPTPPPRDHAPADHREKRAADPVPDTPTGSKIAGTVTKTARWATTGRPRHEREPADLPRSRYITVALANMDPPAAGRITEWLGARLPTQG